MVGNVEVQLLTMLGTVMQHQNMLIESGSVCAMGMPYLIASGEIAGYSAGISVSYAVILATFIIGIVVSYIYFARTDVAL